MDAESSGRESDRQRTYREIYGEHLLVTVQQGKWERHNRFGCCVCRLLLCLVTAYTHTVVLSSSDAFDDWTGSVLSDWMLSVTELKEVSSVC